MNRALWKKYIAEGSILFVAVGLAIVMFAWFRVWIVGELDTSRFKQIVELLPSDWQKYTAVDFDWLISYLGRTALTLDEPLLVMLIAIWAIVRGSDVVSGQISRGTMEMILAQPLGRKKVYFIQSSVTLLGVLLLSLLCWFGMTMGVATTSVTESVYPEFRVPIVDYTIPLTFLPPQVDTVPMTQRVDALAFLPGIVNYFCLGFFLAGLTAFCSSWDRFRWRTLGIVMGIYMAAAMLKILGMASETFSWVMWLTFFSCYEPEAMIQTAELDPSRLWHWLRYDESGQFTGFGALGQNLLLLTLGVTLYGLGLAIFRRRDIPAPV